jgi:hypothetical protein
VKVVCPEEGSDKRSRNRYFFIFFGRYIGRMWEQLVKIFGVGVTVEVRLHGFDLDLLSSDGEDGFWDV